MGPLAGIKILDMSRVLAGPWAGQLLADLGADVIKVERPGVGDDTRNWGSAGNGNGKQDDGEGHESAYYLAANRGKRSITVDIGAPEGQEIIRRLAKDVDIIIENYKVGGLAKYGLDYDAMKVVNPAIIYCSITGFGQDGPYAARAGYDFIIQGLGGMMSITGESDDAGGGPQKVGVAISDLTTGLYSTIAILAAIRHRDQTGEGQYIDMALLDVTVGMLANQNMNYLVDGIVPKRLGNAHPNIVPYQTFGTKDGHIILAVGNDRQFRALLTAAGHEEMIVDERWLTNNDRVTHRVELEEALKPIMMERTTHEWVEALEHAHVPCGPINDIADTFADPQVQARGLKIELDHPQMGTVPQVKTPIKYSKTELEYNRAPPMLGADTVEVLKENGWSDEDISGYIARGIITQNKI